jgi:prolipoprotein diacylglyceryltransferase
MRDPTGTMSASRHRRLRYTAGTVPIAVIVLDFDPLLELTDGLVIRWQTLALAAVIAAALLAAAQLAHRLDLRRDDLLYIVVGIVPGAFIGARVGYALLHLDAFAADPGALLDPGRGGLELAAGVVGGALTGAYVALLLETSIRAWAHVAAVPLLFALGAGKLTMVLGGSGQGLPSDAAWATAFMGPGPWGSLAPALPSHPAQAYEGIGTLLVLVVLLAAIWVGAFGRRDGRMLLIAIGGWALIRAVASLSWRDPAVVGPFNAGGILAIALAVGCLALLIATTIRGDGTVAAAVNEATAEPAWPDPATRPPF